jgi:hypothetical protein
MAWSVSLAKISAVARQTGTLPKVVVKVSASANRLTTTTGEGEGEQMFHDYSITSPEYVQANFI